MLKFTLLHDLLNKYTDKARQVAISKILVRPIKRLQELLNIRNGMDENHKDNLVG